MKYRIVWQPVTEDRLADQYLTARADGKGDAFTAALDQIGKYLENNPEHFSESRSEDLRVIIVLPVRIYFTIDPGERTVFVTDVRFVPRSDR